MKLLYAEDEGAAPAQKAALSLSGLAEQALEPLPAAHGGPGHRLGAGHSAGGVPHRRPGPAGAAALPATGQRREVHRPRGAHPPLCEAGGEAGPALPGKHLPPAAHGAAGKAVRPLLPGDAARTQKEGGYGIGLAVACSLAQANQGSLHAQYLPPQAIRFVAQFPN